MTNMYDAKHRFHINKTLRKVCSQILHRDRSWMIAVAILTMLVASACATSPTEQMAPAETFVPTIQAPTGTAMEELNMAATYTAVMAKTLEAVLTPDANAVPQDTSTPYPIPNGFQLSVPVYILSHDQRGVWRLDPQAVTLERVTPADWQVTSFDVSPTDGRIAYGTLDGKLILDLPSKEPATIMDLREESEVPYYILSLAWSPDGDQLAYAVHLERDLAGSDLEDEKLSGIWVWDLEQGTTTHLLRNEYFPEDDDINKLVAFSHPVWSYDETGMIITGHYWEGINIHWLDPIEPDLDRTKLKNPLEWFWGDASWTLDGRSILVSGLQYASMCDLYRVDRETLIAEKLIDGVAEKLFILLVQEVPEGITFLGFDKDLELRLYFGMLLETGFQYELAGPDDPLCTSVVVNSVEWDIEGHTVLISCHLDRRIVSLDGSLDIDLEPYLGSLADEFYLELYWGVDVEE